MILKFVFRNYFEKIILENKIVLVAKWIPSNIFTAATWTVGGPQTADSLNFSPYAVHEVPPLIRLPLGLLLINNDESTKSFEYLRATKFYYPL